MTDATETAEKPPVDISPARWRRADWFCVVLILAVSAIFFVPHIASRPLSASQEAKAGLIARHMLENDDWFPTEMAVAPIRKPPGYYWMIAGLSALLGEVNEWTIRLPAVVFGVATILLTWAVARHLWNRWTALVSACILMVMPHFNYAVRTARLDVIVAFSVIAATFCFLKALAVDADNRNARSWVWSLVGYLALVIGFLSKGPIGLVLTGCVILSLLVVRRASGKSTLKRDIIRLHPLWGLALMAMLVVPVFIALGSEFSHYFFLRENLTRLGINPGNQKELRQTYSFFYYFATIWLYGVPWAFMLPASIAAVLRKRPNGQRANYVFIVLCFVVPFLLLSCVAIKKWLYVIPILPLLSLLVGKMWHDLMRRGVEVTAWVKHTVRLAGGMLILLGVAVAGAILFVMAPEVGDRLLGPDGMIHLRKPVRIPAEFGTTLGLGFFAALVPAVIVSVGMFAAGILICVRRYRHAFVLLIVAALAGLGFHDHVLLPVTGDIRSDRAFARDVTSWIAAHPDEKPVPLYVCAGEPYEMVFYLGHVDGVVWARDTDTEAFKKRVRPENSPGPGRTVNVVLMREWFDEIHQKAGPLREIAALTENRERKHRKVFTRVKLLPKRSHLSLLK